MFQTTNQIQYGGFKIKMLILAHFFVIFGATPTSDTAPRIPRGPRAPRLGFFEVALPKTLDGLFVKPRRRRRAKREDISPGPCETTPNIKHGRKWMKSHYNWNHRHHRLCLGLFKKMGWGIGV